MHCYLDQVTISTNVVLRCRNSRESGQENWDTYQGRKMHILSTNWTLSMICIQIPLETQVKTSIVIKSHKQTIQYEGESFLCKAWGKLGHTISKCKPFQDSMS